MNNVGVKTIDTTLTKLHFEKIRDILYKISGIFLKQGKEELVKARLGKRLRELDLPTFDAYISFLETNSPEASAELAIMTDALTTNKTSFFREAQHFDFIVRQVIPRAARQGRRLRIWCAGCSSGEEPYTLTMCLLENVPDIHNWDMKILATDISPTMLRIAKTGLYSEDQLNDVPSDYRKKYFIRTEMDKQVKYKVAGKLSRYIKFAQLNLMGSWPMKGPFDAIMCRNVMIYFDKPTREKLVARYYSLIKPGGYLFVGHSESLTGMNTPFRYVQPAVYMK